MTALPGIKIRAKLMARDVSNPLHVENALSRDARALPFRDRLGRHTEGASKGSLTSYGCSPTVDDLRGLVHGNKRTLSVYVSQPTVDCGSERGAAEFPAAMEIPGLPPAPFSIPDPATCRDFAQWVNDLTNGPHGVTKRQLAAAAGATPQAATKWASGGNIEIERLARISLWVNVPLSDLRRLVDERKLSVMPMSKAVQAVGKPKTEQTEFAQIWAQLDRMERREVIGYARSVLAQKKRTPK